MSRKNTESFKELVRPIISEMWSREPKPDPKRRDTILYSDEAKVRRLLGSDGQSLADLYGGYVEPFSWSQFFEHTGIVFTIIFIFLLVLELTKLLLNLL